MINALKWTGIKMAKILSFLYGCNTIFVIFFLCFISLITSFYAKNHGIDGVERCKTLWDYYGFCSKKQKKALAFLLKQTGIDEKNSVISGSLTQSDLWKIMTLVQKTQCQWVRRTHGKERWDVVKKYDNTEYIQSMLPRLKVLGMVDHYLSDTRTSDAICVLGATGPSMNKRLKFLEYCIKKGLFRRQNILLLSGERPLQSGVDGLEYDDLIKKKGGSVALERDLLQYLYDSSSLPRRKWPVTMIHGKKGSLPRATTESTVKTLLNWLKNHSTMKTITFVSSQPHVLYQKAIVQSVLQSCNRPINVRFVGAGAKGIDVDDALAALGSYIWAITPSILSRMSLPKLSLIEQQELQDFFKESYGKQESLYRILPKN